VPTEPTSDNLTSGIIVTSPANGAIYPLGTTIPFSVTANIPNVQAMGLYVNYTLWAYEYSSSYTIWLQGLPAGVYVLTAAAWDSAGVTTYSAVTTVTVSATTSSSSSSSSSSSDSGSSNQPPNVSLTSPADGATFNAPASLTLSASASDSDGTIANVEFYANSTLVGSDTSNPYSFNWNNVGAGSYSLTAVARDNAGGTTSSATREITVGSPTLPSTVLFSPSGNDATSVNHYVLDIFPSGANPTVANPVSSVDLGKPPIYNGECSVDISTTIRNLAPGSYFATVTAIGSGGDAQSAASPLFTR
jgi:hypothetical protein